MPRSRKKTTRFSFEDNPEVTMADSFIRYTGTNVFLTGKAGTGKTSFLAGLKEDCHKQIMVTAPTGVAAINAGGVTLHSFFQLPFGPYIPGQTGPNNDYRRFFRFSKEKKRIIKGLDLLVIDEISMVRADLLDSVDAVLRRLRRDERPFGGVQLLLIGDLFQLPPVAKPNEWHLLKNYYPCIYFFASQALAGTEMVTIELKKIYRQSDRQFIDLLNAVRENRLNSEAATLLEKCADKPLPEKGSITLTTHNRKADDINQKRLDRLGGNPQELTAEVEGEFPEQSFPTLDRLILKKGAQVMFLKNDESPDKLYYNGKIGRVKKVYQDCVLVTDTNGETSPVEVKPTDWKNITYKINEEDQTIEEEVIGSFSQIPLKLAWAVTIHKSQGLTFDRAIVDAEDAFAHGQTYVALSRCRSLDGLMLSSSIPQNGFNIDPSITEFMETATTDSRHALKDRFHAAQIAYQQELLMQCFDFSAMGRMFYYFMRLADTNRNNVRVNGLSDISKLKNDARNHIFDVGNKFRNQLRRMMTGDTLPDNHNLIKERTRKASAWFTEKLADLFTDLIEKVYIETDNKTLKKQMSNALDNLCLEIRVRTAGIRSCADGFSSKIYLRAISSEGMASIAKPKKTTVQTRNYTESDIEHPEMFETLKEWRADVADELGVPRFFVLHQKVLIQITVCLPEDEAALAKVKGIGPKTIEKYGKDILRLVREYREKNNIKSVILPEPKTKKRKPAINKKSGVDTKQVSLSLFQQGMDIRTVADERGLAASTIEGHLCSCIEKGTLSVDSLVDQEKQKTIEDALHPGRPLKEIKDELGEDFSYNEIKAVVSHRKFKDTEQQS